MQHEASRGQRPAARGASRCGPRSHARSSSFGPFRRTRPSVVLQLGIALPRRPTRTTGACRTRSVGGEPSAPSSRFPYCPQRRVLLYSDLRKEALLSSQIEGTQSSSSELLRFERDDDADGVRHRARGDGPAAQPALCLRCLPGEPERRDGECRNVHSPTSSNRDEPNESSSLEATRAGPRLVRSETVIAQLRQLSGLTKIRGGVDPSDCAENDWEDGRLTRGAEHRNEDGRQGRSLRCACVVVNRPRFIGGSSR